MSTTAKEDWGVRGECLFLTLVLTVSSASRTSDPKRRELRLACPESAHTFELAAGTHRCLVYSVQTKIKA